MPDQAQAEVLKKILATNAGAEFGKRHGFSQIKNVDDYRMAVSVQTYEELRPFIERQELTGETCLTSERPVYYQRTSGTVGAPKDIPVTLSGLNRIRHYQQLSAYTQSRGSNVLEGKVFGVAGQAVEGKMAGGTSFGSASGLLYQSQSPLVRSKYVLPPALFDLGDYDARYLAMAIYGLSEPRVTCVATANPSTLVRLLSTINGSADLILDSVATGRLPGSAGTPAAFEKVLTPNPLRATRLADTLDATGRLTYADIWPNLRGIVTWTGGSCGVPLRNLKASLPDTCRIIELGYLASEVRGTINVDVEGNVCLPALLDTFFEFADREAWEAGAAEFLLLHELEDGRDYYVFVTTADGLYRYDMNDIVRVGGPVHRTPSLVFLQKGKGVTSITGEKLYETQVLDAVMALLLDRGIQADFFIMLADQENAAYTLFLEAKTSESGVFPRLSDDLDNQLRASNIEYESKRDSGRCRSPCRRSSRGRS